MAFDVSKYGFELTEDKEGLLTYERKAADMTIVLIDCFDMFTLYYWQNDSRTYVANRYRVEKQEQLDFLIFNGRIGYVFE